MSASPTPPSASAAASGRGMAPAHPEHVARGLLGLRLSLLTLLAGVALLGASLGGPIGGVSQSLAHKLAAHAQSLLRTGPAPAGSRTMRGEAAAPVAFAGVERRAAFLQALAPANDGARATTGETVVLALGPARRPSVSIDGDSMPSAAGDVAARSRAAHLTPPSRAPPAQA
jgi:hypothetical protein